MSSALSINTMSTPIPTQADNLPPFDAIEIVTRNDASSVWGFKHWLREIQVILTNLNLLAIISRDLQRPTRDHPHYQNWLLWSNAIGHWLVCNVTERNSSIIVSMHRGLQLADEMWYYIECLQWTEEHSTRRAEFGKLWGMKRDQFDTLTATSLPEAHTLCSAANSMPSSTGTPPPRSTLVGSRRSCHTWPTSSTARSELAMQVASSSRAISPASLTLSRSATRVGSSLFSIDDCSLISHFHLTVLGPLNAPQIGGRIRGKGLRWRWGREGRGEEGVISGWESPLA